MYIKIDRSKKDDYFLVSVNGEAYRVSYDLAGVVCECIEAISEEILTAKERLGFGSDATYGVARFLAEEDVKAQKKGKVK